MFHGRLCAATLAWLTVHAAAVVPNATVLAQTGVEDSLPTIQQMIDSRTDVWGMAARQQPNGASYEFFEGLLPPLRWVNTDFRHYPLVLSAPRSPHKTRWISNGSAVNSRANKPPMWHELGAPIHFYVGNDAEPFGKVLANLEGPAYLNGYLPVVSLRYQHRGAIYREEVFAPVEGSLAENGAAMLRFEVVEGQGRVEARIEPESTMVAGQGELCDSEGRQLLVFSDPWRWDADDNSLSASLTQGQTAELAVFSRPSHKGIAMSSGAYDEHKSACADAWEALMSSSIRLHTPETMVNNAWRAMLIGSYMIAVGDRLHYSSGNAYAKLYESECGDTLRSIMLFGGLDVAPAMLKPLLQFDRQATRFHVAGHKLQLLAFFYWMTRDAASVRSYEPLWRPAVQLIRENRKSDLGLLPKDNYAGDINQQVYSLNSNANAWKGLRDVAAMLDEMGSKNEAKKLKQEADNFREAILKAVAHSERLDTEPPFIPLALLSDEPAHDPLTATRTGSYYNLMAPYVIGSEIFGPGSDRENWLLGYLERHGAIAMGMIRSEPHQGQFDGEPGVNPLYGLRYQLALLRRDEREKAIVGFYGQLAQGMTRGTFIGGEGSRFRHGDADGRSFYLPPNSASNAAWLITLRTLLIQDWDLDGDSQPDTLRLLYATPRRWLSDGGVIQVTEAPTAFGDVTFKATSKLNAGQVVVDVLPPPRPARPFLLRAPLPDGWKIESAEIDGTITPLLKGDSIDLSGRTTPFTARFKVRRN